MGWLKLRWFAKELENTDKQGKNQETEKER
jgi:hypothetical protein